MKCVGRGIDNVSVQGKWLLTTGGRPMQVLLYIQHGGSHASDIAMSMGVSRHVSFYYLFFNNSLLYCTIHCQINISESSKMLSDS